MLWVFPPLALIGAGTFRLLAANKCYHDLAQLWKPMFNQLAVVVLQDLPYHKKLYTVGSATPVGARQTTQSITY